MDSTDTAPLFLLLELVCAQTFPHTLGKSELAAMAEDDRRSFGTRRHTAAKVTATCRRTRRFNRTAALEFVR